MEEALDLGKSSATGTFNLFIGYALSNVIMAVGLIIVARLLSPAEYGLYVVAIIPSTIINLFQDWGVSTAMTRYTAALRAEGKDYETGDVVVAGMMFEVATGAALSLLSFFMAEFFASVLGRPASSTLISIVSITIFSGGLLGAAQAILVGFEKMALNGFTMVCQAVLKTALAPLLILLGYGVLGAVWGYTLGFVGAGSFAVALVYFVLYRPVSKSRVSRRGVFQNLRPLLKYGVPLNISAIITGALTQTYAFMMALYASNSMIGNYQIAISFAVLLGFFSTPISTVLLPVFSKLNPSNDHKLLKTVFTSSVKYTAILLTPATMAVMALSTSIVDTLFGGKYADAPLLLALYVITNLYAMVGNISIGSFLSGLGETKMIMNLSILTLLVGLPLAFILIPPLGVLGVIIGTVLCGVPSLMWGLHWIWKRYEAKPEYKPSAKIFTASAIAATPSFLVTILLHTAAWIQLVIGLAVFLIIYIAVAPAIGAVSQSDIRTLRTMFSGLGIISKIINLPLGAAERVTRINKSKKLEKTQQAQEDSPEQN